MDNFSREEQKEIYKLRSLFPKEIAVKIHRSEDGGFIAEVSTFPGVITEADTFSELIEMVNDAVRTYFEVPKKYISFVPSYLPSIEFAQAIGIFPPLKKESEMKLQLVN